MYVSAHLTASLTKHSRVHVTDNYNIKIHLHICQLLSNANEYWHAIHSYAHIWWGYEKKEQNIRKSFTMNKNNPACRLYAASSRMFSGLHADSKISLIRLWMVCIQECSIYHVDEMIVLQHIIKLWIELVIIIIRRNIRIRQELNSCKEVEFLFGSLIHSLDN